jgi:hypothetical protein
MASSVGYSPGSWYYGRLRLLLQDLVEPYRYPDDTLTFCLNSGIREFTRLRPDIFLDPKYQQPLRKGDLGKGSEGVGFSGPTSNLIIPVPESYIQALLLYANGLAQFLDVADTQDQRAAAFLQKAQTILLTVAL